MRLDEAIQATLSALAVRDDSDAGWRSELRERLGVCRDAMSSSTGSDHSVEYGMGYGSVAQVPWVVILRAGQSARQGHYPVLLFARDGSAAFLSLNQGTELRSIAAIRETTDELRSAMTEAPARFESTIDLRATTAGPRKYEAANLGAFRYETGDIPAESQIREDVVWLLELSDRLQPSPTSPSVPAGNAWIFQSSPDQYDLEGALESLSEFTWLVNQYPKQIHAGDRVYLWETGADAGFVASGEITSEPAVIEEHVAEVPYWRRPGSFAGLRLRTNISIERVIEPRITRAQVENNLVLLGLPNLRFANATNYPLMPQQESELSRLIDGGAHAPRSRLTLKIAPGQDADLWPDCLEHGYIRVGWDDIGDLREYRTQSSLVSRFRQEYPNASVASASRLWLMRQLQPGDLVIANRGTREILGVGTVVAPGLDWLEDAPAFRQVAHVRWDTSLARPLVPPILGWRPTIREVEEGLLCQLLPELCAKSTLAKESLTFAWLQSQTLWAPERLTELVDAVRGGSPQLILAGPPGTGKTWVAQHVARYVTDGRASGTRLVQFHPSYTYEQFIQGLRPTVSRSGAIEFKVVDGVVIDTVSRMRDADDLTVIIIDEMNRANLSKVFGELMYLFEYRDAPIDLQYSTDFRLPRGLRFVGSMNTADRSIRSIDVALRRRFDVFECPPDRAVLEAYYTTRENLVPDLFDGFDALNAALTGELDRHHTIGHTFFMANPMTDSRLRHVWRHKIAPLIDEYFFDQPDIAAGYDAARFWPSLG